MFVRRRPLLSAMVVLAACSAVPVGAGERGRSFVFTEQTPFVATTEREDGLSDLEIEGFRTRGTRVGAPDVPTRTVLVALPPGTTPRLEVRLIGGRSFRGVRPSPVPRIFVEAGAEEIRRHWGRDDLGKLAERALRRRYEPDNEQYEGEGTLPRRVAWLGKTGVLRDQRYVEVHLAPVRFDRERQGLVVDSAVEVTVHFDGDYVESAEAVIDDRFEPVYRQAFVNYSQGRLFRLSALEPGPAPGSGATSQATSGTSGPIRRIRVAEDGPVRLDHALFFAEAPEFLGTDPTSWRLVNRGVQVPLQLHQEPGDDALLEAGEWVQFYGQALDDEPANVLNHELLSNPIENLYQIRDFSDVNAYFLTVESTTEPTMTERDATPPVGPPEPFFVDTARVELDDFFLPVPGANWFWLPFTNEGSGPRSESVALPGLSSGSAALQVRLQVRGFQDCFGVDPDHKTLVSLENDLAQTLVLPSDPDNVGNDNVGVFDGNTLFVHDFAWTHTGGDPLATDPLHVRLDADDLTDVCPPPEGGGLLNENILDWIEVDYQRDFVARGDALRFSYQDGAALFEITGLTSSAVEVYEITDEIGSSGVVDTVRLTGVEVSPDSGSFKARFRMDDDGTGLPRSFVVAGHGAIPIPAAPEFEADRVSTLVSDTTQADLVVIAHPDLLLSSCSEGSNVCSYDVDCTASPTDRCELDAGTNLDLVLARRATQGISSRVVRIQDVEDEFNFGLPGPLAIQNFLAWLLGGGWVGDPPAYVMLVGDGSYDYKAGGAAGNYIPTMMMLKDGGTPTANILPYYSADNLLAAVAGDDHLADMAIGRVTARLEIEVEGILGKILNVEENPAMDAWNSSVLFLSDRGKDYDEGEALEFEAMNDDAELHLAGTNYGSTKLRYWTDICQGIPAQCNAATMETLIKGYVNGQIGDGAALVQFVGHGNFDLWSDDVFFCANEANSDPRCLVDDTAALTNFNKLPMLLVHNCLTGGFHSPALKTFGEQWLKSHEFDPGGGAIGGASAVFAPSGLGFRFIGKSVITSFWDSVFGNHKERIVGIPVMNSLVHLCATESIEACQYYTLLGDPTSRLALPDVGPAANLVATPSTGVDAYVDLVWDASSTLTATYDIWRIEVPAESSYTRINEDPVTDPFYTDTPEPETGHTMEHTKVYRYYVVAVDGGFESAWSNFNTECDPLPGNDCVQAQPLNLVPPQTPSGVTAVDAETGGTLLVSWSFNPEVDIAQYLVHYGTTPGLGQSAWAFPTQNQLMIGGLQDGIPHYVAVQAINTSGTESLFSPSVIATPNLVLGVKAPDFIDDLLIGKNGAHAELSWGAVTQDIYGKPATVNLYEIYRGATPLFLPAPGNLIGTSGTTSFTDLDALAGGGPDYHYLVRAVDTAGNPGGLGNELPRGIIDLELQNSACPPNKLCLAWSQVTDDFDGEPTVVTHYQVWGSDTPITRGEIEAETVDLLLPVVNGTLAEITPAPQSRYYSVIAVDARGNRSPF